MAMHEFICNKCLRVWEEFWKLSEWEEKTKEVEEKTKKCPNEKCNSTDIQKVFYPGQFRLTGKKGESGFHGIDYHE